MIGISVDNLSIEIPLMNSSTEHGRRQRSCQSVTGGDYTVRSDVEERIAEERLA